MFSGNPTTRDGMLAGGMAMLAALLAMQLISRVLGPRLMLTEYFGGLMFINLVGYSGELARFLLSGGPSYSRIVGFLVIFFLIVGTWLGRWVIADTKFLAQRVMQAAATILFATLIVLYLVDSAYFDYFLQEVAITLALSFFVFAYVLHWLLTNTDHANRWRIGGIISIASVVIIIRDVLTLGY